MNRLAIYRIAFLAALFALCLTATVPPAHAATIGNTTEVALTGTVSCARCQGIQPTHKGYTPYSWALYSVSQGDDIVLVVQGTAYRLQGDKNQILKFMGDKVRVTGRLEGSTLAVEGIGRASKGE